MAPTRVTGSSAAAFPLTATSRHIITHVITRSGVVMLALKLTQIGNSVGVILLKEVPRG
jgi:hypothetical protein